MTACGIGWTDGFTAHPIKNLDRLYEIMYSIEQKGSS